jgi:hypothetical protein
MLIADSQCNDGQTMPIIWPSKFVNEGQSVGRILTGYINLEVSLMHCVQMGMGGDFDAVLKTMFKRRGESPRIDRAEKLGIAAYQPLGLDADFARAIRALRYCLRIRNQYAHWVWWDDYSGKLAFANLEDLSQRKRKVPNLDKLKAFHLTMPLLLKQEAYFNYVDNFLSWINFEGRVRTNKLARNMYPKKPTAPKKPAFRLP